MSQIPVITVTVAADAPVLAHGETEARPRPEPSVNKSAANARAANAPPMIAGHATPEADDSAIASGSTRLSTGPVIEVSGMMSLLVDQCQNSASRMMIGIGTPRKSNRMERPIGVSI
jgi:hypothetical protein